MRLLRPAPGECADRQTILELKAKAGQALDPQNVTDDLKDLSDDSTERQVARTVLTNASKVNIQPFLDEHEEIQKYLEENYFPMIAAFADKQVAYDRHYETLAKVNGDLWSLEDQARILRDAPDKHQPIANQRAAEVLFLITSFNDERASLVKTINALWNINVTEKLY